MGFRIPHVSTKVVAGTVGAAAVGVGGAALFGALPGTEGAPGAIGDIFNNLTGGLFNIGSTAVYIAGAVALFILLK